VRPVGFEPTTRGLKGPCSAPELRPRAPPGEISVGGNQSVLVTGSRIDETPALYCKFSALYSITPASGQQKSSAVGREGERLALPVRVHGTLRAVVAGKGNEAGRRSADGTTLYHLWARASG
jgi:hypothetical protein